MSKLLCGIVVIGCVVVFPAAAYAQAQAAIAGSVKDTSGAVLPGVTVEASSPALIEKSRSVVADSSGQYRIVDLRPGVYVVTFTLPGFSTVRREGIELAGAFVANVNVEMRVGSLEETITVTGEAPIVDVSSVKQQAVMTQDVLTSIPTGRAYQNLHVLVPGVTTNSVQDVGGNGGDVQVNYTIHGGQFIDSRNLIDGMSIAAPEANGGRTMFVPDVGMSQEVVITTSQALAESDGAGVTVNVIPREGGNALKGMFFATGANDSMQSNNFTSELQAAGLKAANRVQKNWDLDLGVGGPILRGRMWFFGSVRWHGANNYVAGMFKNKNAGNPNAWTFDPDPSQQNVFDSNWLSEAGRLTWQATPRNKFNGYYEDQLRCVGCTTSGTAVQASEFQARSTAHPLTLVQASWTSPATNRVLLEAGVGGFVHRWAGRPRANEDNVSMIPVTEQAGPIPGLSYRSGNYSYNWTATYSSRASLTYTTGAQNIKIGYNGTFYNRIPLTYNNQGLNYRFNNGIPNQLTEFAYPLTYQTHMNLLGLYAQDQWTLGRLTLQGGVRFDQMTSSFPAGQLAANRFIPVPISLGETDGVDVKDITPRMGVSYNVSGNGKTAVKVNIGKYVVSQDNTASPLGNSLAPFARLATSVTRTWTDFNSNFVPDCDLVSINANLECGAVSNRNFGTTNFSTTIDPALSRGWGVRPYTWSFEASVQHEVLTGMAVTAGYFRRWLGNFIVTDNLATTAADYRLVNLPIPADSRLSGGVANGVPDVNPDKFNVVNNQVTAASNYGAMTSRWNGLDLTLNVRRKGVLFQGGVSTGRVSQDSCDVAAKLPEVLFSGATVTPFLNATFLPVAIGTTVTPLQYCNATGKFLTQLKLLGAYTLPRIEVQLSGTFQALPGPEEQATYNAPNSVMAPLLGRPLSAGANSNVAVNLLPPMSLYGDRINQLDFRVAKIFRFSGRRLQVSLDLFNALNSSVIQTYNNTFIPGGSWLVPTAIMSPRLMKVTAQVDF